MSLTELAYYTRKAVPLIIIGILGIFIAFFTIKIIFEKPVVTEPPKPSYDVAFGKINSIVIPEAKSSKDFKFTYDTIEGVPISVAESAKVYFIPETNRQIGYTLKTNAMAEVLGFDIASSPGQVDFPYIKYEDAKRKLNIDITRYNYEYQYTLGEDDTFLANLISVPSTATITSQATDFIKSLKRYPDELVRGKPNIIFWKFDPIEKKINVSESPKDANMAEVDFYRADVNELPSVTSTYFNSKNYVLMLYHTGGMQVIKAQVKFFEIAPDQVGTYPLKSAETAWKQVIEGKGFVVGSDPDVKDVTIKEMFLGYYDPDEYAPYLQPVYVFMGGRGSNFVVYIPAVDDSQITAEQKPTSVPQGE